MSNTRIFRLNKIVAGLDRIALKDVLDNQALLTLRFLHNGAAGVIVEQLLFAYFASKIRAARSDEALTSGERVEFYRAWCRAINRLSRELTQRFVSRDGCVDWQRLLQGDVITA
jgi:hypothetical protein